MRLQGNLLGSPDGEVPLLGGLGVAVLAVLAGEGLRGEDGEATGRGKGRDGKAAG